MKAWLRFPRVLWLAGIVVLAAIAPAIALSGRSPDTGATNAGEPLPTPGPSDQNTPAPEANAVTACPDATVTVSTAAELTNALSDVAPGTVIHLAEGTYQGEFTATGDGTPDEPITLCGSRNSVLDGGAIGGGYVLHVENASHWVIQGFTVQNGQKGVMLDGTSNSLIADLRVQDIGDEAIHLRAFSVDNQVLGNEISDTGLRKRSSVRASTSAPPKATGVTSAIVSPTAATGTSSPETLSGVRPRKASISRKARPRASSTTTRSTDRTSTKTEPIPGSTSKATVGRSSATRE